MKQEDAFESKIKQAVAESSMDDSQLNEGRDVDESNDSGFGTLFTSSTVRLMNPDGSLNVRVKGMDRWNRINFYKEFVKLSGFKFYFVLFLIYVSVNLLFTFIYYEIGLTSLSAPSESVSWLDAFFFSTQTFTTLGYGHIHPSSVSANVVASIEAFVGLLYFAVATGLVYGRFSHSKASIRFSDNILLYEQNNNLSLMLRLANVSAIELSELEAEIIMSWIEMVNAKPVRRYNKLKLELDKINLLTTSWTIIHKINASSPCNIIHHKELYKSLEFMVFITAFDEIFDEKVKVRTSYIESQLIENAKFVPITSYEKETAIVNLDNLSSYVKL